MEISQYENACLLVSTLIRVGLTLLNVKEEIQGYSDMKHQKVNDTQAKYFQTK